MPDSDAIPPALPAEILTAFPAENLLAGVFATSITALVLLRPVQAPGGEVVDFSFALLSEAAQRMLNLPAQPIKTHLEVAPGTVGNGIFDFYRQVWATGQPGRRDFNYQLDGFDAYYRLAARRVGAGVLVSFTDTADESRTPVEIALRESQAREQAALAEAEQQRANLHNTFMQAPAMICIFAGPQHVFELVNPLYQALVGDRPLLGRPIREAMPELAGQPIFGLLDRVYTTGETFRANEMLVQLDHDNSGPRALEKRYYNFIYQARRDTDGQPNGILVFAYEVTAQVMARQQLETSEQQTANVNEELAASNEELQAANEEIRANNDELFHAQLAVRQLNMELEMRVSQRTVELQTANEQAQTHNDELAQANRLLQRTNSDLDNFVYAASHDLKQPINNLVGLFDELRRAITFADPEEAALLPMMDEALHQLSSSIEGLAEVGQVQRDANLPAETVYLAELVQEVLQTLQPQVQAAHARITSDFAAAPTITYSRANLRTILLNLLSNSLKYADPARRSRIHLSLWKQDGRPVLLAEDNGLGFDVQRHQTELFQLFRRFHTHTEGTGVGLYLINRIVQGNGGRIEVESEIGEGSTFRVYL